ncbi:MAG: hypothetical protein V5B33_14835 [Candidatus Accumulibacter sp. UW20]|jgi:hypothetical protein
MTPTDILISIVASIAANFLTPAIKAGAERAAVSCVLKLKVLGRKMAGIRLRQLQEERSAIEALHGDPIKLAYRVTYFTVPQVVSLWVITISVLIYTLYSGTGQHLIHSNWSGAIFGLVGYATRFPIWTLVTLSELRKVSDIHNFRANNSDAQEKVQALLLANKS